MRTILFRTAFVTALAISSASAQSAGRPLPDRYRLTDFGPVGGPPAQPFVITDRGLVSGGASVADNVWHSILWFGPLKMDIGAPGLGGPSNVAFGINENGQAVGQAEASSPDPDGEDFCGFGSRRVCLPYIWQNGLMTPLANRTGAANAINSHSQIVGMVENTVRDSTCPPVNPALGQLQQFQFKPVLWENGKMTELPTVSQDPDGIAFHLNEKGQAVGGTGTCTAFQANGNLTYLLSRHATLWQDGKVTDLGNLGGIAPGGGNVALHVNNQGQAVGISGTLDDSFHGFVWTKETGIQDIGTLPDDAASVALANNDRGDVVGLSMDADFNARAFVRWHDGTLVDLNSLLPADSPLFLFHACYINIRGEIIGMAVDDKGDVHGYMATPDRSAAPSAAPQTARFDHARRELSRKLATGQIGARLVRPGR